jgi:hypothetical protein
MFLASTPLQARAVQLWNYSDLMLESDLVVVVEPLKNENNPDQWEWIPKMARGVTTTFKVLCVLHGNGIGGPIITMKHFVYKGGEPPNGGLMVNFVTGPLKASGTYTVNGKTVSWVSDHLSPTWLVFLRKGPDGVYVPTSGQIDPSFSFRELHHPSMFNPTDGME